MEKINYGKQRLDLVDRLLRLLEKDSVRKVGRVTDPATIEQLQHLRSLGIRPLWIATRDEAEEMILHHKQILASVKSRL